jgi:hypothetical protein
MASLFRQNRFRSAFVLLFFICLVISAGMLLPDPTLAADYPPAGSEITSLQGAYNQVTDGDTIKTKSKTFYESLVLDRSIHIILNGGYSDNSYTTTNGFTNLSGSLTITNGAVTANNLVIGDNGSDALAISNLNVTVPRITWTTDQLADSRVDYGETSSYGMSVAGSELSTNHNLVLSGLKPNITYHYIASSSRSGASAATADSTFTTPDFIAATVADIGNSAVIEVSGNYDAKNADGSLNVVARQTVAQEYFKTHGDNIDFLVMFSTFDYAMPDSSTQGFYTAVKNNTQGINQPLFDNSSLYGSNSKLQGTIDMGNVSTLAVTPYSEQLNQTLTVLSHELIRRFGAYVRYKLLDNSLSTALLGKDNAHWSYLLDSQGSVMYGNGWKDNGDGSFTSTTTQNSYSQLDLYLMGMIPKEQVPSMLLINNPAIDKTQLPALGATITGTASSISINDIVAAEGERIPNASTSQKQFNVGYILLVRHGDNIGQAAQTLEVVRKAFAGRFAEMTQGIGSIANVPASLDLIIDTPADNATITGPSIQVTGAVLNSTGAETGVMVNGIPATVNGTRFIANGVDLQQGANTITATATDVNGLTSTVTRTVTAQSGNYIRIRSNIESGIAPLDIALAVNGSFSINSSTLTTTGPVTLTQLPGSTPTSYLIRLPVEGSYILTVQATGPDGLTYEDSVTIIVLQKNRLSWLLKQKWEGIKAKISANDVEGAVSFLESSVQNHYRSVFTALGPRLPVLSTDLPTIRLLSANESSVKCRMDREETVLGQIKLVSYPIYFTKENGLWKLTAY